MAIRKDKANLSPRQSKQIFGLRRGVTTSVEWSHSPAADFIEKLTQELLPTPFRFVSCETITSSQRGSAMSQSPELAIQILDYYQADKLRVSAIARQLR